MRTPIHDFVTRYAAADVARLHMPGHKGRGIMGCEARDITEIAGADSLYEAEGIIAESERNAAALFGAGATFYSAEGASLCVRAMLYLALTNRAPGAGRPVALAARNAHKSFLYAAALCDFDVEWLWPEQDGGLCACPVSPEALAARLDGMGETPFCVYVTSPDYLGGLQDVAGLSKVCRARGVPLLVDNAHGAYLKFLPQSLHPIDLGADLCCDSAHKTLPVLTGGAYLHISRAAAPRYADGARAALALFGSTSPSYLILDSLDLCSAHLAGGFPARLRETAARVAELKAALRARGFIAPDGEPMKLTLTGDGFEIARRLRAGGVECEYADAWNAVMMFSPHNPPADFARALRALSAPPPPAPEAPPPVPRLARAMTIRQAVFAPSEAVPAFEAAGRVCAAPSVACPPAIPIAVSGERLTAGAVEAAARFGVKSLRVVREKSQLP